ncbi:DUF3592 domain-containing protein [Crocosphaera sp.]|uniref:DUF3592 domain-containing protein n=1 Tax=Crocosphaera sp. TaxID=2729996 RepID=UPI003F29516A
MGFLILIFIIFIIILLLFSGNFSSYIPRYREKQAIGKVTSLNSTTRTNQYGVSYVTYIITYEFKAEDEKTYTGKQSIGSKRLSPETSITVYYSPTNPNQNRVRY